MKPTLQLLGIAYDEKSSFLKGARKGPAVIREVLHDGSSNYLSETGVDLSEDFALIDHGDINPRDYSSISSVVKQVISPDQPIIFLGGDHSISYPLIKVISEQAVPFDILHFDAHTDLYDVFEDDHFSHACPFARIMEDQLCQRLIQLGIRTISSHQQNQIDRFGVEVIRAHEWEKCTQLELTNPLYISIDLDGFDPAFAPGVSHLEPGGISPRQFIDVLKNLSVPILAADIVELNPSRDVNRMTAALACKLIKELAAKMLTN